MKRLLTICITVCLLGCGQAEQNAPALDAEVAAPRVPVVTLPTQPVLVEPTTLVTEDDGDDVSATPKQKTKKKSPKKDGTGSNADPAATAWVSAGLETKEELSLPPEAPSTSPGTDTTTSDNADLKPTALDCPEGSIATGMTVFINDAGETVGFLSLHCHHVNDDGRLGEREQSPSLTLEVPATAHLKGRAQSFSCLTKRADGVMSGWRIRADVYDDPNAFEGVARSLREMTIECKSLVAKAEFQWTLSALPETVTATGIFKNSSVFVGCSSQEAVVGVDLLAEGTTDADARLQWIGRRCRRLKTEGKTSRVSYSTGLFGGHRYLVATNKWRGGGEKKLFCPTGFEAIGLFGQSGLEIYSVGIICINPETFFEERIGPVGGGGGDDFELRCRQPKKFGIVRLRGARIVSGSWDDSGYNGHNVASVVVKKLGIACEDPHDNTRIVWESHQTGSTDTPDYPYDEAILHDNQLIVPLGHKITGLDLRTGARVDALGFIYERLPWHSVTYFDRRPEDAHTTGLGGGSGGGESRVDCPLLQVAVGLIAKKGDVIDSIGLVCEDPAATDDIAPWFSPLVGGGGGGGADDGGPHKILCPDGSILQHIEIFRRSGLVTGVHIACIPTFRTEDKDRPWSIPSGADAIEWYGGLHANDWENYYMGGVGDTLKPATYEIKHAITGLRIRSGDYVDAIGLFYHALE